MSQMTTEDQFPANESRALKKKLTGIVVGASTYPGGRTVPVTFVEPDLTLVNAQYPGIYITYAEVARAQDREVRGPTNLQYALPGLPTDVEVPADFEDKDNLDTVDWGEDGFDRLSSPYPVADHPVPYNLDFNIAVLTRNYQQAFALIAALDDIERIPQRFGFLEVPEDGTIRTLDLLGGPETSVISDEDGKRLVQTLYSVRVAAELNLFDLEEMNRVEEVQIDGVNIVTGHPYL